MSIRLQLLAIALATLMLPWAGCRYARELEATLRVSQENSLKAAADTIANALSAEPRRVFGGTDGGPPFDASKGDLYVFQLHNQPLLDGYREDWNLDALPHALPGMPPARLLAANTERYLYLYLEVDQPAFVAEPADVRPERDRFDRVDLTLERPDASQQSWFFATSAPGLIQAQTVVTGDDGISRASAEPRVQGFWLQTSRGYHLEARIPRSLVGARIWIEVTAGTGESKNGFAAADSPGGRLFGATSGLDALLGTFIGGGIRATVVDMNGLKLGRAGSLAAFDNDESRSVTSTWYRRMVADDTSTWPLQSSSPERLDGGSVTAALRGHSGVEWLRTPPGQVSVLTASAPLSVAGDIHGAVILEQAGDQLLDLRDRALTRLLDLTLLASALAAAIAFGVASWISMRIGRLRVAAETAIAGDGKIRLDMPEAGRADEIGALARSFQRLLARLNEDSQYLRTLGAKLSHELRTPLTIVRSSLDNLESEGVRRDQRQYLTRAREGVLRLQSILRALGAAARVEESISQAERTPFDLKAVLEAAAAGYRDAFPTARIALETPDDACFTHGAPDLIVQMLDKLIENAVDFCPPDGLISVRLTRAAARCELAITNDGPPIPLNLMPRLFDSLFEHRPGRDDRPHFGLGLYIVRLVAEFHGGTAVAANRPDGAGALFTVRLPIS